MSKFCQSTEKTKIEEYPYEKRKGTFHLFLFVKDENLHKNGELDILYKKVLMFIYLLSDPETF